MEGGKDPFNRGSFPWYEIDGDILSFFRKLGDMRKHKSYVFGDAEFVPVSAADGVICYERKKSNEFNQSFSVVVLVNRGDDAVNYTLPPHMTDVSDVFSSEGTVLDSGIVRIPPRGFVILENVPVIKKEYRPGAKI